MMQLSAVGDRYRLEAWVKVPLINRVMMLFLMPEEMVLDSSGGGFVGVIPRQKARVDVNKLLAALQVQPIE